MYTWHEMFLNLNSELRVSLIQISLEIRKTQSVSFLMNLKKFGFILKALICQMNIIVLG